MGLVRTGSGLREASTGERMLYWHLGLKRTSTTSLQTALVVRQGELREAGLIYPDDWRKNDLAGYSTHQGLCEVFETSDENAPPVRHFREYLGSHNDRSILLSSEFATEWLGASKRDAALRTISLAQAIMPVTCMWTLRRLDDRINSQCLRWALLGMDVFSPEPEDVPGIAASFADALIGLRHIEELTDEPVVYAKYTPDGMHNEELLRAIRLPIDVRRSVESALRDGPRLNPQLTLKAATVLSHFDTFAARMGTNVDWLDLQRAFFLGEFKFSADQPCELMGREVRRALHEEALHAARKQGLDEYVEFFEDDEIDSGPPVVLTPDVLSDQDLEELVDHLQTRQPRDVDSFFARGYGATGVGR